MPLFRPEIEMPNPELANVVETVIMLRYVELRSQLILQEHGRDPYTDLSEGSVVPVDGYPDFIHVWPAVDDAQLVADPALPHSCKILTPR